MTETDERLTHCSGCGIKLQSENPEYLGYVPRQSMDKSLVICQRCFRIKHYNEVSTTSLPQDEFLKILGHIADTDSLIVNIIDIFDFEGSMISGLQRFVGANPIVLIVNKVDLLPKVSNWNKMVNWIQRQVKAQGLKVVEIVLCSAKTNFGFDKVIEAIDRHRKGKDVFVTGATNVGKSTLINRLIRDYSNLQAELTTSLYPGTTLDVVRIPLDDGQAIMDTPGIVYASRLTEIVAKKHLDLLMPDKPLKPLVFQLNEGQTLFFAGFARFDFIQGSRQSFTCFISNAIQVHRTKRERADELYETHRGEMLSPPELHELEEFPALVKHPIRVTKGSYHDIVISGLGWIKVNSDAGATLEVYAPKGIKVILRESLI